LGVADMGAGTGPNSGAIAGRGRKYVSL
jgi:hypothetical protein